MNSPVQKGDRHARVAEPIPRPTVLQISRGVGAEVSKTSGEMRRGVGRIVRELCQRHGVELVEGHALPPPGARTVRSIKSLIRDKPG